jgi:hypothetical protein
MEEKVLDIRVRNVLEAVKKAHKSGVPQGFNETTRNTKADRFLGVRLQIPLSS